jgi:hypothetical protein
MKAFRRDRLLGSIVFAAVFLLTSLAHASTVSSVNLTLRLESTGYSGLTLFDQNFNPTLDIGFLDSRDNVFGIRPVEDFGFSIGGTYTLMATGHPADFGLATTCTFGAVDCRGTFFSTSGVGAQQTFWLGDGRGATLFRDFGLGGGTNVGDRVVLGSSDGGLFIDYFNPSGVNFAYAGWSSEELVFTVVENNLAPIPLPASVLMLLSAIAGLGAMRSLRRGSTVPAS